MGNPGNVISLVLFIFLFSTTNMILLLLNDNLRNIIWNIRELVTILLYQNKFRTIFVLFEQFLMCFCILYWTWIYDSIIGTITDFCFLDKKLKMIYVNQYLSWSSIVKTIGSKFPNDEIMGKTVISFAEIQ